MYFTKISIHQIVHFSSMFCMAVLTFMKRHIIKVKQLADLQLGPAQLEWRHHLLLQTRCAKKLVSLFLKSLGHWKIPLKTFNKSSFFRMWMLHFQFDWSLLSWLYCYSITQLSERLRRWLELCHPVRSQFELHMPLYNCSYRETLRFCDGKRSQFILYRLRTQFCICFFNL